MPLNLRFRRPGLEEAQIAQQEVCLTVACGASRSHRASRTEGSGDRRTGPVPSLYPAESELTAGTGRIVGRAVTPIEFAADAQAVPANDPGQVVDELDVGLGNVK